MTTLTRETAQLSQASDRSVLPNMVLRLVTGLIFVPIALGVFAVGGWLLTLVILLVVALGTIEFFHMERGRESQGNTLIGLVCALAVITGFHIASVQLIIAAVLACMVLTFVTGLLRQQGLRRITLRTGTTVGGVLYIAFPFGFLISLRSIEPYGLHWLLAALFATWGADTAAYFSGRLFGRTPLAPRLSPSKTVEGAIGGVIGGILSGALPLIIIGELSPGVLLLLLFAPFVAILGDLFESAMKRYFNVKDSGVPGLNPFPGHGGVLDRVDSLICMLVLFYGYTVLSGLSGF